MFRCDPGCLPSTSVWRGGGRGALLFMGTDNRRFGRLRSLPGPAHEPGVSLLSRPSPPRRLVCGGEGERGALLFMGTDNRRFGRLGSLPGPAHEPGKPPLPGPPPASKCVEGRGEEGLCFHGHR